MIAWTDMRISERFRTSSVFKSPSSENPSPKELAIRFAGLLVSGVLSALFLALLASGQLPWIPAESVVFILLFLQWQTLGLTLAKLGTDQVILAAVARDASVRFNVRRLITFQSLPLAFLSSIPIGFIFFPGTALIAFGTIVLDVYSLSVIAEMNGRRRYGTTAVANLLNYPLFFLLAAVSTTAYSHVYALLIPFAASSLVRAGWVMYKRDSLVDIKPVNFAAASPMVVQQVLNYLLYRMDQLALAVYGSLLVTHSTESSLERFVFLAKFPEFIAGGIVVLSLFILPFVLDSTMFSEKHMKILVRRRDWLALSTFAVGIVILFLVYRFAWKGGDAGTLWPFAAPFLLHALLVLPANLVTLLFLSEGHLKTLLRNLLITGTVGLIVVVISLTKANISMLSVVIPIQLVTFLMLAFGMPLLPAKTLFTRSTSSYSYEQ